MKHWTKSPAGNSGQVPAERRNPGRKAPEVITSAGGRSSSKLATHTAPPDNPSKHR